MYQGIANKKFSFIFFLSFATGTWAKKPGRDYVIPKQYIRIVRISLFLKIVLEQNFQGNDILQFL